MSSRTENITKIIEVSHKFMSNQELTKKLENTVTQHMLQLPVDLHSIDLQSQKFDNQFRFIKTSFEIVYNKNDVNQEFSWDFLMKKVSAESNWSRKIVRISIK